MMNFYAYRPVGGEEPRNTTFNRKLFKHDNVDEAKIKALKEFGPFVKLYFYIDFFNRKTFTELL